MKSKSIINEEIQSLRNEIVESQKARIDLLKYKLTIVAALGAFGLGFSGQKVQFDSVYLISLIPFTCAFVDLLCLHNTLRIFVISRFLWKKKEPYETFIRNWPDCQKYFVFEDIALYWSSLLISVLILIYGIMNYYSCYCHDSSFLIVMISGLAGIIIIGIIIIRFRCLKNDLITLKQNDH